jgi:ABC-2 type transport system permease protein
MNGSRVFAIVLRQYYLTRGSVARVVPLFIWVVIDMVLWGFITKYLNSVTASGFNFVPALLGAVLFWDFLMRVMQGVTMSFFEDVWSRNFLNIFATPMSIAEYVTGLVLWSVAAGVIAMAAMLLIASPVFGLSLLAYGAMLVPFVLVLFLFGVALGIGASAMVLRLGPAAEWFVWPIPAIISPFVGVFYPLATLPAWMQAIGYLLPPTYVFEGMRAIIAGEGVSLGLLAWSIVLAVVYVLIGRWFFGSVYRRALRTGLIARYSAETMD